MRGRWLYLAVALALSGCGGGGGGKTPASASLSGSVTKGPVAGAELYIYRMDASGQASGDPVAGPIITAADGSWSVSIPASEPRPLLVVASGGTYTDEATGASVTAGEMNSLLPDGADSVAVTPVSELLVRSARKHLASNPEASLDQAVDAGRDVLGQVLGISFDPLTTVPSSTAGATDQALQYAATLGGLSQLANSNSPAADPFAAVMALAEDASDGVLDGLSDGVPVDIDGINTLAPLDGDDLVGAISDFVSNPAQGDTYAGVSAFTVTASAGTGGGISPASISVLAGGSASFTVTPENSHNLVAVTGCGGSLSGNRYTASEISAACSVSATFAIREYPVTIASRTGGSISPASASVPHGESATFSLSLTSGWKLDSLNAEGCDVSAVVAGQFSVGPVTSTCLITPAFSRRSYPVSSVVTAGDGSLTPTTASILHGDRLQVNVTPALGYVLGAIDDNCGGDGSYNMETSVYTTAPVTGACAVSAAFELQTFEVSVLVDGPGAANPELQLVSYGQAGVITLIPDVDHIINSATGCEGSLDGNIYTTGVITGACLVNAAFGPAEFKVTTTAVNGSISPDNPMVPVGEVQQFTFTADVGYELTGVSGCGGSLNGTTYTTAAITEECTVSADFERIKYTVTANAGANGSVTPTQQQVSHGDVATFVVAPDGGYRIAEVSGCGGVSVAGDGISYTSIEPIVAECTLNVTFELIGAIWNQFNWGQAAWQ